MLIEIQPAVLNDVLFKRSSTILCFWDEDDVFTIENFTSGKKAIVKFVLLPIIDYLNHYTTILDLQKKFPQIPNILLIVRQLIELDILVVNESDIAKKENLINEWEWDTAAKYYHLKTNYINFESNNEDVWRNLVLKSNKNSPPPSPFYRQENIVYEKLPIKTNLPVVNFQEVLENRRSCRAFIEKSIDLNILSNLLYYCWGMTGSYSGGDLGDVIFKNTPSGGARHPIEVYIFANNIKHITPGIYHYDVQTHSIGLIQVGKFDNTCVEICSGQRWVQKAAVVFVLAAILKRTMWKYEHSHAYRVVNLDAGHLGQTFHLVCQNMGLGPFTTAALNNEISEKLLGLNPIEQPVMYVCATGYANTEILADE